MRSPLCHVVTAKVQQNFPDDVVVTCDRCGKFRLARALYVGMCNEEGINPSLLPYLAVYTREVSEHGEISLAQFGHLNYHSPAPTGASCNRP